MAVGSGPISNLKLKPKSKNLKSSVKRRRESIIKFHHLSDSRSYLIQLNYLPFVEDPHKHKVLTAHGFNNTHLPHTHTRSLCLSLACPPEESLPVLPFQYTIQSEHVKPTPFHTCSFTRQCTKLLNTKETSIT